MIYRVVISFPAPVTASVFPPIIRAGVGSYFNIYCTATGSPAPSIIWSKLGGQLSPRAVISNGRLMIANASNTDSGIYKCTAYNSLGSSSDTANVSITGTIVFLFQLFLIHICISLCNNSSANCPL